MFKQLKEIWISIEPEERKYLKIGLKWILIIGGVSIFFFPIIFNLPAYFKIIDFTKSGSVGDTINGVAGPFIALLASILTFLAFYIQFKANQQQKQQFLDGLEKQKMESSEREKSWKIERFENRFFELVKFHNANVADMKIGENILGKQCFVKMFYELKFCYTNLESILLSYSEKERLAKGLNKIDILSLSYKVFFYGIGAYSEKHYASSLSKSESVLFKSLKKKLEVVQEWYCKLPQKLTIQK